MRRCHCMHHFSCVGRTCVGRITPSEGPADAECLDAANGEKTFHEMSRGLIAIVFCPLAVKTGEMPTYKKMSPYLSKGVNCVVIEQ